VFLFFTANLIRAGASHRFVMQL